MKKSFMLFTDSLEVLEEMTNEQKGILFDAIYKFHAGRQEEIELDFAMKMAFAPFKKQFERDIKKYNAVCERNKRNGNKGGRPRKQKNETSENQTDKKTQNNRLGFLETQQNPKNHDNDNDTDTDKDTDNDNDNNFKEKQIKNLQKENPPVLKKSKTKSKRNTVESSKKFYDGQLSEMNGSSETEIGKKYITFVDFLFGNFATANTSKQIHSEVLQMENQLTFEDFQKLMQIKPRKKTLLSYIQQLNDGKDTRGGKYSRHKGIFTTLKTWFDRENKQN